MAGNRMLVGAGFGGALAMAGVDPSFDSIANALDTVRRHLGMEVGFISEFLGDERVFRYVSAISKEPPIRIGHRLSLDRGYCKRVVNGEIPQLIPDTQAWPILMTIPETRLLPIGSHLSVPIMMSDGTVYGTFCCFSAQASPFLNERDLAVLKVVADLVAAQIEAGAGERLRNAHTLEVINSAIAASEPSMVYQPVFDLRTRGIVGAEALSRFSQAPYRTPDHWFNDADIVGIRPELEIVAIRNAIKGYRHVWKSEPKFYLAVNASARTLTDQDFPQALRGAPLDRIIIEITEHDQVDDYDLLDRALAPLRAQGIRVAVDDAGSGYASLRHILRVRPDIIKLDISLTRDIDKDPMRAALASAVVQFSRQTHSSVLAEGIETEAELAVMARLGVQFGQGFLLGKPASPETMLAARPSIFAIDVRAPGRT